MNNLTSRTTERIPVMKIGHNLLVSIQVDLHDRMALALKEDLSNRVVEDQAKGVIIDISALDIVDSFIGRVLGSIAGVARLLDADTVLVGMRPAVAITLTELGVRLGCVKTALTVEDGLEMLDKMRSEKPKNDSRRHRRQRRV